MPEKPRVGKKGRTRRANRSPRTPPRSPPIRSMGLDEFVRRLRADTNAEKHFAVFLGAGCSVTSGIPAAGDLVRDHWIPRLRDYQAPERGDHGVWAAEVIDGYDEAHSSEYYGELIKRLFLTPEERQREIENLCDGRTPSFGYAILAQLVAQLGGRFNVVLTTNFDDLLADALYLYTEARPLVIYHESLAAFIRPTRTRPLIVKLHGDHRLSPRNTALETQTLEQEIQRHTAMVLHDRGVIFMGYGGGDVGILKLLNDLPAEALPFGAYWVHPEEPRGAVREWLSRREGVWVRSGWFDEVMLMIRNEFDLPHPNGERFTRIFQDYHKKFQELSESIRDKPAGEIGVEALRKAVASTEALLPDMWKVLGEAQRLERPDPELADKAYREAVRQFPKAAPVLGSYALFLASAGKDNEAAEAMYHQALEADPHHAINLSNFANFLSDVRHNYEGAEAFYKRSIDADPKNANTLSNYALFLKNTRRDFDAAEAMFRRALESDPKRADTLTSLANLLKDVRQDYDNAEIMYKRALESQPKHIFTLLNYAKFLSSIRQDHDTAEVLLRRAREVNPRWGPTIRAYATFLHDVRKDVDGAESLFTRALRAAPTGSGIAQSYAHFLYEVRKDFSRAELFYRMTVDLNPNDANARANLARILLANRANGGIEALEAALELLEKRPHREAELECMFYLFANGPQDRREKALRAIRRLLDQRIRASGWDLSRNTAIALREGHTEGEWLPKLEAVVNGNAPPDSLDLWHAWQQAGRMVGR
jgi:Tfp pilus assembly protein PilF